MTHDHLPEDLEPVLTKRDASTLDGPSVRISKGHIRLSASAYEALGSPVRVEVLFGQQSRILAIRPVRHGGYKATVVSTGAAQLAVRAAFHTFTLPPGTERGAHHLPARLVEGALLVGPLPGGDV